MAKAKKVTPPARTASNRPLFVGISLVVVVLAAVIAIVLTSNSKEETTTTDSSPISVADLPAKITPQQYDSAFMSVGIPHFLLDVRTPEEFAEGHIADAANIAVETLAQHLDEVPKDQPIVLYCRSGNRSAQAAEILKANGYTQVYDLGGIRDWSAAGYSVVQ